MGSLERTSSPELEGLPLVNPQCNSGKTSPLEISPQSHFVGPRSEDFPSKCILSSIFHSIKIALFSNKLNLLIPCGPLAILVDKLTHQLVSNKISSSRPFFDIFFSLFGLIIIGISGMGLHFKFTRNHSLG